jgi:hypothetical protein
MKAPIARSAAAQRERRNARPAVQRLIFGVRFTHDVSKAGDHL